MNMKFGRNRNSLLLLLPLLLGFAFQATQYARAPAQYDYYLVYAKNADIAVRPGNDISPNGQTLLQNSTAQQGYYALQLGKWAPGFILNYTDAFRITNREVFAIRMIGFNFTDATGVNNLMIKVENDTTGDGVGDAWVTVWDGTSSTLSTSQYIYMKAATTYGDDGGTSKVWYSISLASSGLALNSTTPQIAYNGNLFLWFTSATF